jgi:hypothetical protein
MLFDEEVGLSFMNMLGFIVKRARLCVLCIVFPQKSALKLKAV